MDRVEEQNSPDSADTTAVHVHAKTAPRKTQATLGLLAVVALGALLLLSYTGSRMVERYSPLVDATMEIKFEATRFHLWFEELVQGDTSLNKDFVWNHLNRSKWFATAMLEGGSNDEGTYSALIDAPMRAAIQRTLVEINTLETVALARLEKSKASLAGSNIDQEFDATFNAVLAEADAVETALQNHIQYEMTQYRHLTYLLFAVILLGSIYIIITLRRNESTRQHYILELEESHGLLKGAVNELSRSNADLERFASVAAHDLLEPTRSIESFGKLLQERQADRLDEEGREFLDLITEGASRMKGLVQDLLSLSRANRANKPFTVVDVQHVCEAARLNLLEAISERGAELNCEGLPVVMADKGLLTQVFQNLIANAIKFQPEDRIPQVHISATQKNGEWVISVKDNGIGIASEHSEEIFSIFKRLHGRTQFPGTGVGLALCRRIVELHGGRIWLGPSDGDGTTFLFTLPAQENISEAA